MKDTVAKPVYSITPFTMIDYPDKTACIIWFAGCNMRCAYCHNPEIVHGKGKLSYYDTMEFLITRKNLLDGVVLSGGECTSHRNVIIFAGAVKKLGMQVKVDTNGSNPKVIKQMIEEKVVDYVALDYKGPVSVFDDLTQSTLYKNFEETFDILNRSEFPFEVRTTVHTGLITRKDIRAMISFLEAKSYKGTYYLQNFSSGTETLRPLPASGRINLDGLNTTGIKVTVRN